MPLNITYYESFTYKIPVTSLDDNKTNREDAVMHASFVTSINDFSRSIKVFQRRDCSSVVQFGCSKQNSLEILTESNTRQD